MKRTFFVFICALLIFVLGCQPAQPVQPIQPENSISGMVQDESNNLIAGAVMRVKATERFTTTDENGKFVFADLYPEEAVVLTAWAEGYYIGGGKDEYTCAGYLAHPVLATSFIRPDLRG